MPRPPTYHHPLRKIRACTDCRSQKKFAAMLGVSTPAVQAIENGKLALSVRLARRIRRITGADDAELMKGEKGRAVTIFGQTYSPEFYEKWKTASEAGGKSGNLDDPLFWLDNLAEAAVKSDEPARFYGVKATLIDAVDTACFDARLQDGVEDSLIPFQHVESAYLPALKWRAADGAIRNWFGFDGLDGPDISGALPLRLVRQTTPAWGPGGPAPKRARGPVEMPGRYLTLGVGPAGCRLAEQFAQVLCREHGVDERTGEAAKFGPSGYHRGFFQETDGGRVSRPRFLFADLAPDGPGEIAERNGALFTDDHFFSREEEGGGGFGPVRDSAREDFSAALENFVSRQCGSGELEGIVIFLAPGCGTGSGLGSLALDWFKERHPDVPVLAVAVLPGLETEIADENVVYNAVMALGELRKKADLTLLIEKEVLMDNGHAYWNEWGRSEAKMGRVVAQQVACLTSVLRFESDSGRRRSMAELISQSRVEGAPFLTGELVPWMKLMGRRVKDAALATLMRQFWQKACRSRGLTEQHMYLLQIVLRGRKLSRPTDEIPPALELTSKQEEKLDELRAAEDRFRLTGRVDPDVHEDAAVFYNSARIGAWFKPLLDRFQAVREGDDLFSAYSGGHAVGDSFRALREVCEFYER